MTGTTPWSAQPNVEPIAAVTIEAIANMQGFAVVSGCAATYSGANMNIAVAAGTAIHTNNGIVVTAGNVLLVSDPTNPRWAYHYTNSAGTPSIVSGSAAATPAVPDPGANTVLGLTYVQAALTIANNATYKLDKRVFSPSGGMQRIVKLVTESLQNNTLQNDDEFFFTAQANVDYLVEMNLLLAGADAADWAFAWLLTNMTWSGNYEYTLTLGTGTPALASQAAVTSGTGETVLFGNAQTAALWRATFVIHGGSTGGVLHFQWAQANTTASNTSVLKNSSMTYCVLGAT